MPRKKKEKTIEQSLKILEKYINREENSIMSFKNHRKHDIKRNTFRFTVDIISLEFLISLMEDENIKNVYFNPSIPPPGGSIDGISLRYKVYVEYY
tara:strand:+ start:2374 stop:2661 length:288 start_codon:yes stop_codon:yes gene_type:complete